MVRNQKCGVEDVGNLEIVVVERVVVKVVFYFEMGVKFIFELQVIVGGKCEGGFCLFVFVFGGMLWVLWNDLVLVCEEFFGIERFEQYVVIFVFV